MNKIDLQRQKRKQRIRRKIKLTASRPRLSVFMSNKYVYAQVIDLVSSKVIASASSLSLRSKLKSTSNKEAAGAVGKAIAENLKSSGVTELVFDKSGYKFHGKVKALAEEVKASGINC